MRLAFIRPLSPSAAAVRPPKGDDWQHEPKWDGFRFQVIKDGSDGERERERDRPATLRAVSSGGERGRTAALRLVQP